MILTVTLNPSVDKLYLVDEMRPFSVTRVKEVVNTAGGKGLNVSRVASLAGESVIAMGFVGGHNGALFRSLIQESGIRPAFTETSRETRCCVNVRDAKTNSSTEFLEPGNPVSEEEFSRFFEEYRRELEHADVVTLSGSAPAGLPQDVYVLLIEEANAHGKPVLLDTSGPLLRAALPARPCLVKPNAEELHQLTGADTSSLTACAEAARLLRKQGAQIVAVSLGKDGVLVSSAQGVYRGITPDVPVVNTVGCGDSMVAGFAVCLSRGLPLTEGIRYAVAVSTANALTKETGYFRREDLDWILPQVSVVPMQAQ